MTYELFEDKIVIYGINKQKIRIDKIVNYVLKFLKINKIKIFKHNEINIYINKNYGFIIEIYKSIKDGIYVNTDKLFLFEIEDPLDYFDEEIYFFDNKYYINPKIINISLFDNSLIIYDDYVYKILGRGIKIYN